jgi:hypothetical protein
MTEHIAIELVAKTWTALPTYAAFIYQNTTAHAQHVKVSDTVPTTFQGSELLAAGDTLERASTGLYWVYADYACRSTPFLGDNLGVFANGQQVTGAGNLQVFGAVDSSDPYMLRIYTYGAFGGTVPYTDYEVILSFTHAAQDGGTGAGTRTLTISGATLTGAATTVTDLGNDGAATAIITTSSTGTFVGNDGTLFNGGTINNGDTGVKSIGGTLGAIELPSSVGDLFGSINITIEVTDTAAATDQITL